MLRKQYNMTQEEISLKSGVGLHFVRDLEQGKGTLRLDKVNQLLDFFNYEMVATAKMNETICKSSNPQSYLFQRRNLPLF